MTHNLKGGKSTLTSIFAIQTECENEKQCKKTHKKYSKFFTRVWLALDLLLSLNSSRAGSQTEGAWMNDLISIISIQANYKDVTITIVKDAATKSRSIVMITSYHAHVKVTAYSWDNLWLIQAF